MSNVYLDFETPLIVPGNQAPKPVCMVYAVDSGPAKLVHAADPTFATLLESFLTHHTIVAHNAAFEVTVVMAFRNDWVSLLFQALREGRIQCTLVREKLLRIARGDRREGFALDDCVEYHRLPIQLDKKNPWRKRFGELYELPLEKWPSEAVEYVMADVAVRDVYLAQEKCARSVPYLVDQHRQMRASVALRLTSCWGMLTDKEAAKKLYDETLVELKRYEEIVLQHKLARREGSKIVKTKAMAEARLVAAYAALGREPPRGEPTEKMLEKDPDAVGNIKLDEEACLLSGDPVLEAYTFFAQASTLLNKVARLQRSPIQASYNVLVATGRTSCRQGDDPKPGEAWTAYGMQVQNQPKKEGPRECFISRPGTAFLSSDYNAFEMGTWAQCCIWMVGFSDLAEIINDPKRCPHVEMGAGLRDLPLEVAYALKGAERSALRGVAKGPNFGLPGGMGWRRLQDYCRLQYGVILSDEEAQKATRVWRQVYREAQLYLDKISAMVGPHGSKTTIRQFRSERIRGQVGYCDAANGFFQSLAADIAKEAGWRLTEACYENRSSPLYGSRPVFFVHDEWALETPLDRLHDAGIEMQRIMEETAAEWCPDVRITAPAAAMLRWSKKAGDPVFNKQGVLVPYEWRDAA